MGALCLQQTVAVEPGRRYTMAGRLRSEDLRGLACLQMAFVDDAGGLVQDVVACPKGQPFMGTTDWTNDQFEAVAPANARAVDVRLFIVGDGTVWCREIRFFG